MSNDPRHTVDSSPEAPNDWLPKYGEMAQLIRSRDWSGTPVGPIETWPESLSIVVRLMLTSRYAMWMGWGPELTFFYNDSYRRDTLGVKHPWALGATARDVWAEIWNDIGPRIETVLTGGEATWDEGLRLILERSGYPEETYHTFSYSPLASERGAIAGMLCVVTEETERIIGARRVAFLRDVAAELAGSNSQEEVFAALSRCVAAEGYDIPFAITYLLDSTGSHARRVGAAGIPGSHPAAPETIDLSGHATWPLCEARSAPYRVDDLAARFRDLPGGPWHTAPREALVVPLAQQGQEQPAGFLVAALNPFRKLDADYQGFLTLLAGQMASGLANAHAYEEERRRAEALAELDRAKTTFFSNVSHEFRTPLTLMLGPVEELLSQPAGEMPDHDRELLTVVHRNAVRLQKLVNSLLDFSRIEAGRAQASYEAVDLCAATAELASVFRSAIERAGLRLRIDCRQPLSEPAYVDRDMWEKIILNLLSNGFKYTLEGEISVSITERDHTAEVVVQDTGIGIPQEELPHLFERFHRVESARGRTHEGSGIGLALVQELVRLHGGTISVKSTFGQGSTFRVSLPLGKDHLPPERVGARSTLSSTSVTASTFVEEALRWLPDVSPEGSRQPIEEPEPGHLTFSPGTDSARVLLADDNADMRDYVTRLLAPHYQVEAVADGLQALTAIRRRQPDLIVTDVMMPGLDGFGLLQAVRADPQTRVLPVILLSARAGEEARIEGLEAGADDYVTKPFGARELLARVASQLELARLRGEMLKSDAKVRAIFDQAPIGMYVLDTEMRLREVNPKALPVFADLPDLIGRELRELLNAMWGVEVAAEIEGHFRHTLETGEPYRATRFTSLRADRGVQEYYHWELARITLPSGEAAGVLCTFFDVSAHVRARVELEEAVARREQAEAEARLEAERLQQLARVALAVNAAHSVESVVEVITEEARALLGGRQAVTELRPGPNDAAPLRCVSRPEGGTEDRTDVGARMGGEGAESIADPLTVALIGRDGRELGQIGLVQKHGGNFTEADAAVLTQLAQMAAVAIENARLYEDLREQDRRKDEFLAMLAHELRNPLAPIRNAVYILKSPRVTPPQREHVQDLIERQLDTLVRLVDDLLDVSRVTRGKIQLEHAPVALSGVVRQAIETCQPIVDQQGHRLEVHLPEQPLIVDGDATRLTQVLSNLLNNAAKYTKPGGTIELEADDQGTEAELRVRDTGIGIAPEMLPQIFDLFTQAERTLDRAQGGLGIGLALTRKLVELHGGTIVATSDGIGRGSEFVVRLPLAVRNGEEKNHSPDCSESVRRQRILVVEDNRDAAELLVMMLRMSGHDVQVAYDGISGLDLARKHEPDVILLDIGLPGKNGYDVARAIRSDPNMRNTQLVAMTGYGQAEDKRRAKDAGFDRHLTKPVRPEELEELLNA